MAVTRHPTDAWVAQQLREATPFGQSPTYLIRDNDSTFGPAFAWVAKDSGITILRTAYRAPRMNAICERFPGSVRRECLDHVLILGGGPPPACPAGLCHVLQRAAPTSRHSTADPLPRTRGAERAHARAARGGPANPRWPAPRVPSRRVICAPHEVGRGKRPAQARKSADIGRGYGTSAPLVAVE